ncbi:MAG: heparinase II/III family protein [Armatimonadetes bacterium]|nr:heparinase II/III family protein [Armatimonadota bacterium]
MVQRGAALSFLALLAAVAVCAADDIALNGGAEEAVNGVPAHWMLYGSGRCARIGQAEDGYRGKCAFIEVTGFTPSGDETRKGEDYVNVGLVQGDSNGYTGADAYVHQPPSEARFFKAGLSTRYTVSWWMRGDTGPVNVVIRTWSTEEGTRDSRGGVELLGKTMPTDQWTRYTATAAVGGNVKRLCVLFQVYGFREDGVRPGTLYVDEVSITPGLPMGPDVLRRVVIPARPRIFIGDTPIEELAAQYAAGDQAARGRVDSIISRAKKHANLTDEVLRGLFAEFEPMGNYSVCCPIHPFLVRYYNDFKWSMSDPWHLRCPYCEQEGREHFLYPNPRYPDDGHGCMPDDEVWRQDHDPQWTAEHRGIPWDRWDGVCHGYVESRKFYFKGKAYCRIINLLTRSVLVQLAQGWQVCDKVLAADDPRRELGPGFAHQAQVIMLLLARAHLGDDYLAGVSGLTPDEYQRIVSGFLRADDGEWRYRPYPGFRPFNGTFDGVYGDPVWADKFPHGDTGGKGGYYYGSWNQHASLLEGWIQGVCLLRDAWTPEQVDSGLALLGERVVVSREGDRERLADSACADPYLKRGLFEYELHPYNLESGGDNLLVASLRPRLKLGMMLRDDEIVEKVAADIMYFWSNMASGDGMGCEGSPTYAGGTWAVASIGEEMHGMTGDFDTSAPYYNRTLGGIDILGMPRYRRCLGLMDCLMPDGLYISFEDSCHGSSFDTRNAARVERYCGGVPEPYRSCLDITRDGEFVTAALKPEFTLPSHLLHDNRKAILRAGRGRDQMVAALDYSMVVGHYHEAPLSLMIYAKGRELASDLGYMGSCHHLTTQWIRTLAAHNCLVIRAGNGDPSPTRPLRGDLEFYDAGGIVQVVEVAERDPADLEAGLGDADGVYSRTIALVREPGEDGYVLDICRARGGSLHDYQFFSHGTRFESDLPLTAVPDTGRDLYDYSGFSFPGNPKYGAHNVTGLRVGVSKGPFTATWSAVDVYQRGHKGPVARDEDVALRLWMLDEPGSEVIVGNAPGQRFLGNEDFGRTITQLRVRRPAGRDIQEYVAVIEPWRSEPFIRSVERLPAPEGVVAVKVVTDTGADYLVSAMNDDPVSLRDGDMPIETAARFCAGSFDDGGVRWLSLTAGTGASFGDARLTADGPVRFAGGVEQMLPDEFALIVRSDPPLPAGDSLAGRTLVVQHSRGRSSFTIDSVGAPERGLQRIELAGMPKLMANVLRVCDVEQGRLVVEPPPVLPRSPLDWHVYRLGDGPPVYLSPLQRRSSIVITDERGWRLHALPALNLADTGGVQVGDDVGLSRILPGRDSFEVLTGASLARRRPSVNPPAAQ